MYHGEKKMAHFWARREAIFAICPFFMKKILYGSACFFSRLEQPKRPPNAPRLASVAAAVLWQHYFHHMHQPLTALLAQRSWEALVHWCSLVHTAHAPTHCRSCFMPRGTAWAHLTTDAVILPTLQPLPSMLPKRTHMGDTISISLILVGFG